MKTSTLYTRSFQIIKLSFLFIFVIILFLPQTADFANQVMWRKLFIQVIGAGLASFFLGLSFNESNGLFKKHAVSAVVFFIGTFFFWMIPSSIDETTRNPAINYLFLGSIVISSVWLGASISYVSFVTRMALFIYGLSMLLTLGMIFFVSRGLICAAFTIEMQNEAGRYLLMVFPLFFIIFLVRLGLELKEISSHHHNN